MADLKGIWRVIRSFAAGGGQVEQPGLGVGGLDGSGPDGSAQEGRRLGGPALHSAAFSGDFARFAGVGLLSTVGWLLLLLALLPVTSLLTANAVSGCLCAVANLAVHRYLNLRAPRRPDRDLWYVAGGSFLAFLGPRPGHCLRARRSPRLSRCNLSRPLRREGL
ncbi:MAG: hypothetical protein ACRD0Z_07290 [Acidimicrobiales bacterium]